MTRPAEGAAAAATPAASAAGAAAPAAAAGARDGLDAARLAASGGGVLEATADKVELMKKYVHESGCSAVLQELYEKLVVDQPADPVAYLIAALDSKKSKCH
jgi:hypothetical protein